ncbi:MAG: FAD-binding oxidoreductase [Roseiflexaceae bacterium]
MTTAHPCISEDLALRQQYTIRTCVPDRVAIPTTVTEASEIMQLAAQHGWHIIPWGGGTHQLIGATPTNADLVIVTTALNRVIHHEPNDLTISVEAGMTIGTLRRYLASHGQMLPVDPALPDHTTIGGLIATASDGPRRAIYGILRDMMIGISVIEVNGQVSKAGGMVVKNVSGFDMMKLYHGSFGTLALIVSANFKLYPIPTHHGTVVATFAELQSALSYIDDIATSQLTPVTVELIDHTILAQLQLDGKWGVALASEGPLEAVTRHQHDLTARAHQHSGGTHWFSETQHTHCWNIIHDASSVHALPEQTCVIRWSTLPIFVGDIIERCQSYASQFGGHISMHVRASVGSGYIRISGIDSPSQTAWFNAFPEALWIATNASNLSTYWHTPEAGFDIMQHIRHEFDPQNRLNPQRFVV